MKYYVKTLRMATMSAGRANDSVSEKFVFDTLEEVNVFLNKINEEQKSHANKKVIADYSFGDYNYGNPNPREVVSVFYGKELKIERKQENIEEIIKRHGYTKFKLSEDDNG